MIMKKSLLTIFGAAFLASASFAQDEEIDTTWNLGWYDTLNAHFVVKVEPSNAVWGLKGLTADGLDWKAGNSTGATNVAVVEGGKLKITHTRISGDANYTDISFTTTGWKGDGTKPFGEGSDTVVGQFVNMAGDANEAIVYATIQTDVDCEVRLDLGDINGHTANSGTVRVKVTAGAPQNFEFDFSETLYDWYAGDAYGVENGRNNASELTVDGKTVTYKHQDFIPFRIDAVSRLMWSIDDAGQGEIDKVINVEISNLVIGSSKNAVDYIAPTKENVESGKILFDATKVVLAQYTDVDKGIDVTSKLLPSTPFVSVFTTAASATLTVSPNPATTTITVNEEAVVYTALGVATSVAGIGTLDISVLTPGTYYVVSATGSVTLSVQ